MSDLPETADIPEEAGLTAQWLSGALQRAGYDVAVAEVSATQIGTGQIGKCLRLALRYVGEQGDAPDTLIAKLPSDDVQSRMTGVALRNYLKEVRFYQTLAQQLTIATPRCYFSEIIEEGPQFLLLLEDLAPAVQGDQLAGTHATVAQAALAQLVGLHAPSWNNAPLLAYEWLGGAPDAGEDAVGALYRAQLPGFMERFGAQLAAPERDLIATYGDSIGRLLRPEGAPNALVHVDYRLDNLMLNEELQPPSVTTVDWQSITVGSPLNDVAYFIGAGLKKVDRRACEEDLVRGYYQALLEQGIADYSWDACWRDYRLGTFAGFGVTVIASMLVQQTVRGDEMFQTMARRHSRHALDLDAGALLR